MVALVPNFLFVGSILHDLIFTDLSLNYMRYYTDPSNKVLLLPLHVFLVCQFDAFQLLAAKNSLNKYIWRLSLTGRLLSLRDLLRMSLGKAMEERRWDSTWNSGFILVFLLFSFLSLGIVPPKCIQCIHDSTLNVNTVGICAF